MMTGAVDRALASEFALTAGVVLDLLERAARSDDPVQVAGYRSVALSQLAACRMIYQPVRSRLAVGAAATEASSFVSPAPLASGGS